MTSANWNEEPRSSGKIAAGLAFNPQLTQTFGIMLLFCMKLRYDMV